MYTYFLAGIVLGYAAGAVFGDADGMGWRGVFEAVIPFEIAMLLRLVE